MTYRSRESQPMPIMLKPQEPPEVWPEKRGLLGVLRREANVKCLILTGLVLSFLSALVWCRNKRVTKVDIDFDAFPITRERETCACEDTFKVLLPSAFVLMLYLLYLIETWHSKAWTQLRGKKMDIRQGQAFLRELKSVPPIVWWKGTCYHYVKRVKETTRIHNGVTFPCAQVFCDRINSRVSKGSFYHNFCGVKDVSPLIKGFEGLTAVKIKLTKAFLFANSSAAEEFQEQRTSFFQDLSYSDDYLEMREGLDLSPEQWRDEIIIWGQPESWLASSTAFWIASCLLLSWPFRFLLHKRTGHLQYQVTKLFGSNYIMPTPTPEPSSTAANANAGREEEPLLLGRRDFEKEEEIEEMPLLSKGGDDDHGHNGTEILYHHGMMMRRSVTLQFTTDKGEGYNSFEEMREDPFPLAPTYSQAALSRLIDPTPGIRGEVTHDEVVVTVPTDPRNPDQPPSYIEALRTSRPVFFHQGLTRLRRCFTDRDIHSLILMRHSGTRRRREGEGDEDGDEEATLV